MEKRTGDRCKDRLPAQEAEQRVDESIFYVMNGGIPLSLLRKIIPHTVFHCVIAAWPVDHYVERRHLRRRTQQFNGDAKLSIQPWHEPA